jgi:hypothetical protein
MSELELCLLTEGHDSLQYYGPYNNYLKTLQLDHRIEVKNQDFMGKTNKTNFFLSTLP